MKFFEPNIGRLESEMVLSALECRHLSDGHIVGAFEDDFKDAFGYEYVVAMNSGTSALYSTLMAMGVGPGDEVLVTPYTFIASIHVAMLVGATPVFVDIDRRTYNMDIQCAADRCTERTKACIPVDVFGNAIDVAALRQALPEGVAILQDAIEALGTTLGEDFVGKDADAAVFGFSPNKQMTTCEGGMFVTSNKALHDYVRRMRQHGFKTGDLVYQHMGHNFRMTDVHAAIGRAQLSRFSETQGAVLEAVAKLDVVGFQRSQKITPDCTPTFFVYVIELPEGVDKARYIQAMGARGVPIKPYFNNAAVYPHMRGAGALHSSAEGCPTAHEVGSRTIALPTPYTLTTAQAEFIRAAHDEVVAHEHTRGVSALR